MKKIFLIILFLSLSFLGITQINRKKQIKPFIDTTNIVFKNIYGLWNNYLDTLASYSIKSKYLIKKSNSSINSFWIIDDLNYGYFPDLSYAIIAGNFGAYYPLMKEFFLGFAKRDSNIFEIKTMFVPLDTSVFHNTPNVILSNYLMKKGDSFKLYNKLSILLNKNKIITRELGNLTYYYATDYQFNLKEAKKLKKRIKRFKKGFEITKNESILYFVADNISEIYSWFGIDYYSMDYNCTLNTIEGKAIDNRMILSGGGENYLHEIIHILLKGYRTGKYGYFEEGIACFFGEHVGNSYVFHVKRLKRYLNNNSWIDLSENLSGYYFNAKVSHSYNIHTGDFKIYGDSVSNYTYIIHAVLCDMAFRKGGYNLVKKILIEKADNVDEFYAVIDKYLNIKRDKINNKINKFINTYY